jgi:hypothetical protein
MFKLLPRLALVTPAKKEGGYVPPSSIKLNSRMP